MSHEPKPYRLLRIETTHYYGEYTKQDLIDLGASPTIFDLPVTQQLEALEDEVQSNQEFRENLEDDTERGQDVQGNRFTFSRLP